METVPNDILDNLAELSRHLQNFNTPTQNVDISDILDYDDSGIENNRFGLEVAPENNRGGIENRLLEATPEMTQETDRLLSFKTDVKELSKIENMIDEYTKIINNLKKKKSELRQKTLSHMVSNNIDTAKINNSESFSVVVTKKKINPTTKVRLPFKIREFFIREEKMNDMEAERLAKRIVKWIHDNAEFQSAKVLRHKKRKQ